MLFIRRHFKTISIAAVCVALGTGISAIASAGAASSTTPTTSTTAAGHAGRKTLLHRVVHGDLVVASHAGFANVTFDRGLVKSVSGQQLTLQEGTRAKTYKTITLTIPATARVRVNGQPSSLSAVKAGQRAVVVQMPQRTIVAARTP